MSDRSTGVCDRAAPTVGGVALESICPLTADAALRRAAVIAPDVEAIVSPDQRITFAELAREVETLRAALVVRGIGRGDHVAICAGNGPTWAALFLALGSVGAVAVPVNTRFRADELAHALRNSRSRALFIADRLLRIDFIEMLRSVCSGVDDRLPDPALPALEHVVVIGEDVPAAADSWDTFVAEGAGPAPSVSTPDDALIIQYTSGTTALPKGVLLTHRSMCANAFFSGQRLGLRTGDRFYSARPFFHVAGTTLSILTAMQHAVTLVTMERFQAGAALELMERERCTHFSGNDTIALMLLSDPELSVRQLALRGAWLAASPAVIDRVIHELGAVEAVACYGLSEASPNVAQGAWWEPVQSRASARMLPQPGVEIRIWQSDRDAVAQEPGQAGEIQVRGWNVMSGYYEMPAETAAVLGPDGWLATGDLGRLGADGRLEFLGRIKEVIRVGGENVSPAEVEDILHRHPDIRQAAVVGVPDARLLEVPFAFIVPQEGHNADPDAILAWAREHMAGFKAPRHIAIVESFESIGMTASSKIRKAGLAAAAVRLLQADGI